MPDPYRVLGLPRTASAQETKKTFRKLARSTHPDVAGGNEARFKEVLAAYELLSDEARRRRYDAEGDPDVDAPEPSPRPHPSPRPRGPDDSGRRRPEPPPPPDTRVATDEFRRESDRVRERFYRGRQRRQRGQPG